jgi:hypothetical protein
MMTVRSFRDRRGPGHGRRLDIKIEDRGGQIQRAACVGDVNDAADPALDRRRAEQPVQACAFLRTSKFSIPGSRL